MTLSDIDKTNYIKNNFHQYYDLTLNTVLSTNEPVNVVIPISTLRAGDTFTEDRDSYHHDITYSENTKISDILSEYNDAPYNKETECVKCVCTEVIDGDTIVIQEFKPSQHEILSSNKVKVRLVGINTPEIDFTTGEEKGTGAFVSRDFLEKVVYDSIYLSKIQKQRNDEELTPQETNYINKKHIYLKFDSKKYYDNEQYKRRLAVLIADDKNINEVMLKEGLAEIEYVPPSEFNPYDWGYDNTDVFIYQFKNSDITTLSPYFNPEMTNIVFTPYNNYDIIHKFEVYKGVIFLRLKLFTQKIRMHLLPKSYDCSNTLLIFRDDMITETNVSKSDDYYYNKDLSYINSFYLKNNDIRDRNNPDISSEQYKPEDWENTFCEFTYNISESTRNFNNLQICAGYTYNNSTPFYSLHYTGIKDYTNPSIEDRCTLLDANYDKLETKPNNITQFHYTSAGNLYIPRKPRDVKASYEGIDHVLNENIGKMNYKIIKYINDELYSEENKKYAVCEWIDLSRG